VASGTDRGPGLAYLLDTNSLIYYFQGAPQLDPVFRQIEQGEARPVVSIITEIELLGFPRLTRQDEAGIPESDIEPPRHQEHQAYTGHARPDPLCVFVP
jgi:hypothetical protein